MLEAVPNVSEGRDAAAVAAIATAFAEHASLLDVHSDPDHHRSVYTLAGEAGSVVAALLAGMRKALELVDLRLHEGVHPRVGTIDVVPLVPLAGATMAEARAAALEVARRAGEELSLPVFLYGEVGDGRRPAFFRRGGLAELERRVRQGELRPDHGPERIDPRHGAVLVGARPPLVAYNLELEPPDLGVARAVAAAVRESSGGLPGVQAIGLYLPRARRAQVSTNVLDLERTPVHELVRRVREEAAARGATVVGGELVGLVPERVLAEARAAGVDLPGIDASRTLERALGI
ncbi:MAG TPA: glutamate formimidoyltransferase [Gaiellaceae bacterium]|nr:glutamate formimidoyltransferase [Gaiellaceae bacterium]